MSCELQAPGFIAAALQLQYDHLLCAKHYSADISKACLGLGAAAASFRVEACSLIFDNYHTPEAFDEAHAKMVTKYKQDAAKKWLQNMAENKEKVAFTFTKMKMTCGHCSTQRSEAYNAVTKGGKGSTFKDALKQYNCHQLADHLQEQYKSQQVTACNEIVTLLRSSDDWAKLWGKKVHMAWHMAR